MKAIRYCASLAATTFLLAASAAQTQPQGAPSARVQAPVDLEGHWVSLVTEDWRFRMFTAPAGDYEGINMTTAGREIADSWSPDGNNGCKAYGVGGLMRQPGRLHITWEGDNVLQIETDAGEQRRLLKFGAAQDGAGAGSLQGVSRASWTVARGPGGFGAPPAGGNLNVVTTDMAEGYFRSNGVPYSTQSTLTEYFELLTPENGEEYLVVISILEDPLYMTGPLITSTNFKREPDGSKWSPRACD